MALQRIDKVLANMGIGSRREVKPLFKKGLIEVDGHIIKDNGALVDTDTSVITVSGTPISYKKHVYIMMNKPQGVLSATEDNHQKTAVDLLEEELRFFQPAPAGRLDKDTVGFLLLTNDGTMIHRIISPKKHIAKTYFAKVRGVVTEEDIATFKEGVVLDDGYLTLPSQLVIQKSEDLSEIELTIYEGKFHQVKRMFKAVGKEVVYLKRLSIGGLKLDEKLKLGEYREVSEREMEDIFNLL